MDSPDSPPPRTLTQILAQAGVVTRPQIDAAIDRQEGTGLRSGELLVQMGAATEEDIGWALARQLELTFVDPRPETLDHDLIHSFPEELLRRVCALPLVHENDCMTVAFADPTDHEAIDELTLAAGRPLRLAVATASAIRRALRGVYGAHGHERRHGERSGSAASVPRQHQAGATFLLDRLDDARRAGAGEIHLLPHPDRLEVWLRVAGELVAAAAQPRDALTDVLAWIEALDGPTLDPEQRHAWSRIVCPAGADTIGLAVSLLRQPSGVCVTLEPLSAAVTPALDQLGIDEADLAQLRGALSAPAGLGFIAGPPGAGGSTTLEAMAAELERERRRCVRWSSGSATGEAAGDATALGLSTAFLHGADVVTLDDVAPSHLRDTLAPSASGRWVLARAQATDTFALLEQLASTPLERAALADRIRFVIQQRRVWRTRDTGAAAAAPARCSVFEVLIVDDGLRDALRAGEPCEVLRARASAASFVSLWRRLEVLVDSGLVTAREAERVVG